VDVIQWSANDVEYISASLSPAKVLDVQLNDADHLATVRVPSDQLSLAIGKGGQNVRLAAKLTGWKITVAEEGGRIAADSDVGELIDVAPAADSSVDEVV
jgi:N utilization substance protein A